MSIRLHEAPRFSGDAGTVTVEGDSVAEVNSATAKAMAMECVRGRMNRPGISGQSGPYPVDPETNEEYENPFQALKPGTRFRQDFNFQGGF
jgi:hypothetical protein